MLKLMPAATALIIAVVAAPTLNAQVDERAKVQRVIEAVAANIQARNLSAVDTLFAPGRGVHILEGAGANHGWAEYRDSHLAPELAGFQSLTYRFYSVEAQVRGMIAWAAFRYELAAETAGGPVATEGRGSAVLEQREGRWVIVQYHTSGRRKPNPSP